MHLCYVDESGTPHIPGNTSHYILAGLSIPDEYWKSHHNQIEAIKRRYGLVETEIHVAWMLRPYVEQNAIPDFELMTPTERRSQVKSARTEELLRLQKAGGRHFRQTRKNYNNTESYVHMTFNERRQVVRELAECISNWGHTRLFAECIDKVHFDPERTSKKVDEQAFEQLVSRFERFLQNIGGGYGLIIHDNNETVATKHTNMMKEFLRTGTLWTDIQHIIETPMFVDSQLTNMIQLADLCAYALRRYLENSETELFNLVFQRADTAGTTVVGIRHFTSPGCICKICVAHSSEAPSN